MKKQLIIPGLLLLSSNVVACQGNRQLVTEVSVFPDEVLENILNNLDVPDIAHAKGVSRKFERCSKKRYNYCKLVDEFNRTNVLRNWPNDTDVMHLRVAAEVLAKNNTIASIDLGNNNMGDVGVTELAKALEKNTTITDIHLGNNNIGNAGAIALAKALEKNTTITDIHLGNTNIGVAEAEALAETLEKNNTITGVSIFIDNVAAGVLDKAFKKNNKKIYKMDLSDVILYNIASNVPKIYPVRNISVAGVEALAKALENNGIHSLEWLY